MTKTQFNNLPTASLKPYSNRPVKLITSYKQFNEVLKYLNIIETEDYSKHFGVMYPPENIDYPILIGVFKNGKATLVHELAHVLFRLCRNIGYDPVVEDEPFCYLLDDLFSKFSPFIKG